MGRVNVDSLNYFYSEGTLSNNKDFAENDKLKKVSEKSRKVGNEQNSLTINDLLSMNDINKKQS